MVRWRLGVIFLFLTGVVFADSTRDLQLAGDDVGGDPGGERQALHPQAIQGLDDVGVEHEPKYRLKPTREPQSVEIEVFVVVKQGAHVLAQ